MKVYLKDVTNTVFVKPDDGKVIIKPGITHHSDADKRHDMNVNDNYRKNYSDWTFDTQWSWGNIPASAASAIERFLLDELFPLNSHYKVWMERYLKCPTMDYYNDCSGITEMRVVTEEERKICLRNLYNLRDPEKHKYLNREYRPLLFKLKEIL